MHTHTLNEREPPRKAAEPGRRKATANRAAIRLRNREIQRNRVTGMGGGGCERSARAEDDTGTVEARPPTKLRAGGDRLGLTDDNVEGHINRFTEQWAIVTIK